MDDKVKNMENVITVIYARPYKLTDEDTGEIKEGVSIHYVDRDLVVNSIDDGIGYPVMKNSIASDKIRSLTQVPGVYKPIYSKKVSKGQQIVKLEDVEFIQSFSMFGAE